MTCQQDCTLILDYSTTEGLEALPELIRAQISEAMHLESDQHLGAEQYKLSPERKLHYNGYRPKTVKTRVGEIQFEVPRVRQGQSYLDALETRLHNERAFTLALA